MGNESGYRQELWRVEHKPNAYVDQTGLAHHGYVVHEQVVVSETGRFDVHEHYSDETYENVGIFAVDHLGRAFRGTPNLVDYYGGMHWRLETPVEGMSGYWQAAPSKPAGYCYANGEAPVNYLLPRGAKTTA